MTEQWNTMTNGDTEAFKLGYRLTSSHMMDEFVHEWCWCWTVWSKWHGVLASGRSYEGAPDAMEMAEAVADLLHERED